MTIKNKELYILLVIILLVIWIPLLWLYCCLHPWKEMGNYLAMGTALAAFTGTIISIMVSQYRNQIQLDKQEEHLDKQLNHRYRKSALITLKSIIIQLIMLESNIKEKYEKNKQEYEYDLSSWVIKKIVKNTRSIKYHENLINTYESQFNKIKIKNDSKAKKGELGEICLKTAKFYNESMYYELPKSININLNNLNDNTINVDKLKNLEKEINICLENDNCINKNKE